MTNRQHCLRLWLTAGELYETPPESLVMTLTRPCLAGSMTYYLSQMHELRVYAAMLTELNGSQQECRTFPLDIPAPTFS